MKKALLMGVSGAAMVFAASAHASGMVGQEQGFKLTNNQGQYQSAKTMADGGDAGKGDAHASGGDAGGSYSSKYGNSSTGGDGGYAKAYGGGGQGGDAYTDVKQDQGQEQSVYGSQKQVVYLPDINIEFPEEMNGGPIIDGGAAGPGLGGGDAIAVDGDDNRVLSHDAEDDAIVADRGARVARQIDGVALLGDGGTVNLDSFNVTMDNNTVMTATNTIGPISLDSGDSEGGDAEGGGITLSLDANTYNDGRGGDARNDIRDVTAGDGGNGGDGKALSANLAKQQLKSKNETEGGDGAAYSKSYGSSYSKADGKATSNSYSKTYGSADNDVDAGAGAGGGYASKYAKPGESHADAGGEAGNWQDVYTGADAGAGPESSSHNKTDSAANGAGGEAGPIHSDAANKSDQDSKAMASGGVGGEGGKAWADGKAQGGDNAQMASSTQTVNAATGATQGGNGGNIAVTFGTGNIGAISLGTVSGIATMAQNTGLSANQFTSFSINAHTSF